jgi:hypothetical protein
LTGNGGDWVISSGTNTDDSEWHVLDQNDWTYLGSHPHDIDGGTTDGGATDGGDDGGSPEDCSNGIDDDGDSYIDCDDFDCDDDSSCGGTGGEDCSNGIDDDGDGYIDCNDFDCSNDLACPLFKTKSKNYILKRLSSVNATKTKDQKGVHATREIDDDGDSNARAVRENCVLLCI